MVLRLSVLLCGEKMGRYVMLAAFCALKSDTIRTVALTSTLPPGSPFMLSRSLSASPRTPGRASNGRQSAIGTIEELNSAQESVRNRERWVHISALQSTSEGEPGPSLEAETDWNDEANLPARAVVVPTDVSVDSVEEGRPTSPDASVDETETGISWSLLSTVLLGQLVFAGCFYGFATPSIQNEVRASLTWSTTDFGIGIAGGMALLIVGAALDTRDWDWVRRLDKVTQAVTLQLFGNKRQLWVVTGLAIPLGAFVGLVEECTFRGLLPLILANEAGLSAPLVVVISALIFGCGASWSEEPHRLYPPASFVSSEVGMSVTEIEEPHRLHHREFRFRLVVRVDGKLSPRFVAEELAKVLHAATWAYFISATVGGLFFHALLLSTGNLAVPVVAHGLYDTLAFVKYHIKGTAGGQEPLD